jgi:hypothetical protein
MGMAQRTHTAQMILKLIINRTNTFLRFQVSRYVPFFTLKNLKCPVFLFQKSGHPILTAYLQKLLMTRMTVHKLDPNSIHIRGPSTN